MNTRIKLIKRKVFGSKDYFWQINYSDYFLSQDKTELYLFVPYTEENNNFDVVELRESNDNGSLWIIYKLDKELLRELLIEK